MAERIFDVAVVEVVPDGAAGEFGHVGLADDDGTGSPKAAHHVGVRVRDAVSVDAKAEGGTEAGGVEVVLDRNRHAVQRPEQAAGSAPFIRCSCRCHGAVAVDGDEGVEAVLVVCDLDRVEGRADVIGDAHRCRVWLIVRPARLRSGVSAVEALHHVAEPGGLTP